ncbi:putative chromate transport protein [bioreactor metagenome]|uniref:Putative chromate transport protein n=1 Tax=bioreactor metagenome TaxID=1076179 RepID=A0A644XJ50_9ZZZZ
MIYLHLFYEFARIGLFSVGGGLATIPFLQDLGVRTSWFSAADLANMIAVSESTPGPIGINMATYVGFTQGGFAGSVIATLGLVTPSIIVILIIARILQKFRESRIVDGIFYGLRPASTGLIASAGVTIAMVSLFSVSGYEATGSPLAFFRIPAIILFLAVFLCMRFTPLKKFHPILFIAASAVAGIIFKM